MSVSQREIKVLRVDAIDNPNRGRDASAVTFEVRHDSYHFSFECGTWKAFIDPKDALALADWVQSMYPNRGRAPEPDGKEGGM